RANRHCTWRASRCRCRARRAGSRRRRRRSASTPTRCSRSSDSRARTLRRCARPTPFEPRIQSKRRHGRRGGQAMDDVTKTDKMLARKDGRVGYVTFNNPERHNAVSLDMWAATAHILDNFAKDDDVRVVVLTGAGGKAFVSGADISKFESERSTLEA